MTTQELFDELQRLLIKHPELADQQVLYSDSMAWGHEPVEARLIYTDYQSGTWWFPDNQIYKKLYPNANLHVEIV